MKKTARLAALLAAGVAWPALAGPALSPAPVPQPQSAPLLMMVEPIVDADADVSDDRSQFRVQSAEEGFDLVETRLEEAAESGASSDIVRLAAFYAAHEFWPESLTVLARLDQPVSSHAVLLAAEAEYRLGRYRRVVDRLDKTGANEPLAAMALARLGAYREAAAKFDQLNSPPAEQSLLTEFRFCQAETAAMSANPTAAAAILSDIVVARTGRADQARMRYLRGLASSAGGQNARAIREFRDATKFGLNDWAMRARLQLKTQASAPELSQLALQWSSEAYDREIGMALGAAYLDAGELANGLRTLRTVVRENPLADVALVAQEKIAAALPELFADNSEILPEEAARLFFDNVEFAPPGREGDQLIRSAAMRLKALGLYSQAAALLHHQTFKRLRGTERSVLAAELAALYVDAGEPAKALTALQSTRIAGLDKKTQQRRNVLEARALAAGNKADAAIQLLAEAQSMTELRARADINWGAERWANAGADYAAVFDRVASGDYNDDAVEAALRATIAFSLSGDDDRRVEFARSASAALAGRPQGALIASLGSQGASAHELSSFMQNYRSAFAVSKAGG